jgi:hypothetical protein
VFSTTSVKRFLMLNLAIRLGLKLKPANKLLFILIYTILLEGILEEVLGVNLSSSNHWGSLENSTSKNMHIIVVIRFYVD